MLGPRTIALLAAVCAVSLLVSVDAGGVTSSLRAPVQDGVSATVSVAGFQRKCKTTATCQVVVNPMLRRGSPMHDGAFAALKSLNAKYIRFVPWLPYPRLAVAELEAPTANTTSWDFSLIDPLMEDFMDATEGRTPYINFSTTPQWMWKTDAPVPVPADPDTAIWNYEQGTELNDPTMKELADYYARLVAYYTKGGFTNELGRWVKGHYYDITMWEVLNEVNAEHTMTPEFYTKVYDAIVTAIRTVQPKMSFVGVGLAQTGNYTEWAEYFLDSKNHAQGVPLDWFSYHFYAGNGAVTDPAKMPVEFFKQADTFLGTVKSVEEIRTRLAPGTKSALNELGSILTGDPAGEETIDPSYWVLSGALYAYLYIGLAEMGIDAVGESQLIGYKSQFPSVSLIDPTGVPNARYWALRLIVDNIAEGDSLMKTDVSTTDVAALAVTKIDGTKKVLVVNKLLAWPCKVTIDGASGGSFETIDISTSKPVSLPATSDTLSLGPLAVAVLTMPSKE